MSDQQIRALVLDIANAMRPRVFFITSPPAGTITPAGLPIKAGWYVEDAASWTRVGPYPTQVHAVAYANGLWADRQVAA